MMMNQTSFQDGKSPIMSTIIEFHDYSMTIIIFIMLLVGMFLFFTMTYNIYSVMSMGEGLSIEMAWTSFPSIILISLASSSLWLLYELESSQTSMVSEESLSIKATGHQWYWSYDYADFNNLDFSSYMLPSSNLMMGQFRLLETDNRMVIPWNSLIRMYITSGDVLHSWTIPSVGVKADAIPGRLNLMKFKTLVSGVYYGQCSEICGANHSFMPISMEVISPTAFNKWSTYMSKDPI